jgi:hypothetical protein
MKGEGEEAADTMPKEPQEPILLTGDDAIAAPPALVRAGLETLPAAITAAGARTSERFIEFFTANIRNRNTRMAYAVAVRQFFDWSAPRQSFLFVATIIFVGCLPG